MIVADTNLIAYLLVEGEHTDLARSVRALENVWILPTLWRSEFLNVLTLAVRAGILDQSDARRAWHLAVSTFGTSEHEPSGEAVLSTAIDRGLTAYDAQFVVAALDLEAQLVTSDRRILASSPDLAIHPRQFLEQA